MFRFWLHRTNGNRHLACWRHCIFYNIWWFWQ